MHVAEPAALVAPLGQDVQLGSPDALKKPAWQAAVGQIERERTGLGRESASARIEWCESARARCKGRGRAPKTDRCTTLQTSS